MLPEISGTEIAKEARKNGIDTPIPKIQQLMAILLDNAIEHSSGEGVIEIELKKNIRRIVLSVKNPGEEIPYGEKKI